ncbi:MAG: Transcriptional repressor MprA [Firmicutes bacterium ADurb.Bin182]|nr:MAG: Transcriptional repressor MprA [Firmicutes bacterium ADurb.Bin182]
MDELKQKAYIFGTIFTLANKLQVLGDEFDKNITTKQWLFILGVSTFREPPMISELANFIGYSRQNAKRIAAALQKSGYITISKDENDARALRIELTPKCREYFKKRDKREIEFLEKLFTGFDAESTHSLYKGLIRLELNIKDLMRSDENMASDGDSI